MKKEKKQIRTIYTVNFMAEIIGIITLYLGSIHTLKVFKIDILIWLFLILNIVGLFFLLKFVNKKEKLIVSVSLGIELLIVILTFFTKGKFLVPYFQIVVDILRFIILLNIYKSIKKKDKNKKKNTILIICISYIVSQICYLLVNKIEGITIVPIVSTIYIIGIALVYTIFMKKLEKK